MAILTSADWPDVRDAIDTQMDTNVLPNATIARNIFSGAADQDVLKIDPLAESRTDEDGNRVKRAAIYFCAARLIDVVFQPTSLSATTRDLRWSRQLTPAEAKANKLKGMAVEEINAILFPDTTAQSMPRVFSSVSGTRGK